MTTQMRHCVRAAQQGDKLAIKELLDSFMPYLHCQAKRYESYYPNFEEAMSTAYHGAIHCIINYDFGQSKTIPEMIVASVHNHLRRESYRQQRDCARIEKNLVEKDQVTDLPEIALASYRSCPERCFFKKEKRSKTRRALARLPEMHSRVICLRYYYDYSYRKIAEECGLSRGTVGNYLSSGIEKLKIYLKEEGLAG